MTREEFIKKYKDECYYYFDGYYSDCIDDFLTNIYNDHEAQLKAKDKEIERLKDDVGIMQHIVGGYKLQAKKARSIVAMLFWEWKRHKRMYELSKFERYLAVTHLNNATLTKIILDKAYKMLKDTK